MSEYEQSATITKEIKTEQDIIDFLCELGGAIDADFSGENGPDYLWDESRDAGFDSNAKFIANLAVYDPKANSKKYGIKAYTDKFTEHWLAYDRKYSEYYSEINIELKKIDIPERNYTDIQGMYVGVITAE